jgi:hypothetical protein
VTDSSDQEAAGFTAFVAQLDNMLREFFNVRREQAALGLREQKEVDELKAHYAELTKPYADREAELKVMLAAMIVPQKAMLINGRLRSFSTRYGDVLFEKKRETTKVIDTAGVEAVARKRGELLKLGTFSRVWKLDTKRFVKRFKADKVFARHYASFVEQTGGQDELFVRPNDRFIKKFDNDRLTDKRVPLGPAPDVQDESPDA